MERKVHRVQQRPPKPKLLKVAAYARVSSGKDAMLHSLAAQVDYFQNLIRQHPGWEFCGVFADEAKTGTKDERPEYQKMLEKCRNREVDLVITKSISRFARNTVTLLETVRELKSLGIDVWFEKENLHSTSGDGELMLSILASFAQEESKSVSDNMKWRIRNDFQQGNHWTGQRVKEILVNEKYVGNMLLQKYYRQDPIGKRKMKNQGELPKYFVEQSHEAIISADLFEKVQELVKERTEQFSHPGATNRYPLSGMVQCAACGKSYQRKIYKQGAVWMCATYLRQGKSHCPTTKQISERILYEKICSALQIKEFDVEIVKSKVENILVSSNQMTFLFKDNTETTVSWENHSRSESWTPEMRQAAAERSRKCQK